ncbi:MAG: NlpC/P60 family protein [Chthoniobacterales bacterium]
MRWVPVVLLAVCSAALAQSRTHMVRPGETMSALVDRYGVPAATIQAANNLPSARLPPGVMLRIPPAPLETRPAEPVAVRPAAAIPVAPPVPVEEVQVREVERVAPPVRVAEPEPEPESLPPEDKPELSTEPANVPERVAAPGAKPEVGGAAFARAIAQASGTRYNGRWTPPGESRPWVMDCSNTARWLHREVRGVELPRTASSQYEWLRKRRKLWRIGTNEKTLRKKLQPGDLLFWENTYKPVRKPAITHVMTYLGTDSSGRMKMAGSQSSKGVNVYNFTPGLKMGGYNSFLWFRRHGKFVAYGRP